MLPLGPLWFLPCLLIAEIIFVKLYNRFAKISVKKFVAAIIASACAGFILSRFGYLPLGLNVALVAQIFLLAGVLIRKYNFVERIDLKIYGLLVLFILFGSFGGRVGCHENFFVNDGRQNFFADK